MKQSIFLLPLTLLFSLSLGAETRYGQSVPDEKESNAAKECPLTLPDAPALLGMRLGMSFEETKAAAPNLGLSRKIRKANGIMTSLSSRPNEEAEGVVNNYLDDRLVEIDILFSSANKWSNTVEFVREFSKKFNLPEKAWAKTTGSYNYLLTCQGFTIEARDKNHIVLSGVSGASENRQRTDKIAILKGSN